MIDPDAWPAGDCDAARAIRAHDWAATALGPLDTWPEALKGAVGTILHAPIPMAIVWGEDSIQICNDAFDEKIGGDGRACVGRPASEVWADVWPTVAADVARVRAGESAVEREDVRLARRSGERTEETWWRCSFSSVPDARAPNGVGGVLFVAVEISDRVRAREDADRTGARLRALVENLPHLVWQSRDEGRWTWASAQWIEATGLSYEASLDLGWLAAVHPEDRERVREAWAEAGRTGRLEVSHRLLLADGRTRWFQTRAHASTPCAGGEREWVGSSSDIDEMRRLQDQQKLLLGELQHRVRNMLAIVRSIARRTGETAQDAADFGSHFEGRLNAFARTQAHVARDPRAGLDLEYLVAEELTACAAREGARVTIGGPKVQIKSKAAETLTLAIHELATNSVKFGALAGETGAVAVVWDVEREADPPLLRLTWRETGIAPDPRRPAREGFGTELLRRTLPYELDAAVRYEIGAESVLCEIVMPLNRRTLA
ncbi:sensor histidine kinase [Salinarimonas ramus]|uniref:Blue-light-activated histidine kinase n=1 Tax=Salinarimonas ramus TaxID=690164 RepID=A0A917Q3H0_9HYPH|nr:HWE histidine kinase domain-containing protein [Salinarimonas ramus]GGK18469.1 hypothetical protein GCM10011322_01490 [Salinarimonas ramus]